jgi:hypothetical protein
MCFEGLRMTVIPYSVYPAADAELEPRLPEYKSGEMNV